MDLILVKFDLGFETRWQEEGDKRGKEGGGGIKGETARGILTGDQGDSTAEGSGQSAAASEPV